MQITRHGSYWLIKNYAIGSISRNIGCADSITMATYSDYKYFKYLATLVKRWRAPVSFAVYAPGYDFNESMESIQYVRNCLPESELIQQFVTFHIYFPEEHMPQNVPHSENEALKWRYNCDSPPYGKEKNKILYRKTKNMTYPINVGRNIARKAVNTYFVLTNDIEQFPSPGIVDKFLRMVARNISRIVNKKRVFPLNVFELKKNSILPNNKLELKAMLKTGQASIFHKDICLDCHKLPYDKQWLKLTTVSEMSVIGVSKRHGSFKWWEPFYISDNKEPLFDERVSWEGQKNKRIQGHIMCVLDYEYHILNDGFLTHTPGISTLKDHLGRRTYIASTDKFISNTVLKEHDLLYGSNKNCYV